MKIRIRRIAPLALVAALALGTAACDSSGTAAGDGTTPAGTTDDGLGGAGAGGAGDAGTDMGTGGTATEGETSGN